MKTYVISGATSGIGRELAIEFSRANIVFAGYRDVKKLDDLKSISGNIIPFYIDMENCESISAATDFILENTQKVDTLINAAGCVIAGTIENIDLKNIRKQFEVNTFSHLQFSQKLLDRLEGGKIINISSMASFGIFPFVGPYCASKRALDILFNAMVLEFNRDIKVVSIKPGVIATPLWEKSIALNKDSIEKCPQIYEPQMKYLVENARKNGECGLDVKKVRDLIVKVDGMKKPKASYTIGKDAKLASFASMLPQDFLNYLIRAGVKLKVKMNK